nr:hypothetical protein [Tanacetum cinerariifolium]
MKKIAKQDASLACDENITPKKKTIPQNASPASSSRRSSTSSRKQTKQTLVKDNPTNMRKSVRLENKNLSNTPQSKEKSKKTQGIKKKTPVSGRRNKLVEESPSSNTKSKKKKSVRNRKNRVWVLVVGKGIWAEKVFSLELNKKKRSCSR